MAHRIAIVALTALIRVAVATAQQPASWNGIYSDAQAKRGEALYARNCAACHGKDLTGSERAPAVAGASFMGRWNARPHAELLDYMQAQMPLTSPGGLTRQQNADILAFMLQKSGVSAGQRDLGGEGGEARSAAVRRSPDFGQVAKPSTKRAEAFFSVAQAKRGQLAFNRNCGFCHTVDPKLSTPKDLVQALPQSFGGHFVERVMDGKRVYPTALALYSKFLSMPAFDTQAITEQQRVDIVAYVLQANGLPAGKEEIPVDTHAMRLMMLNEPGFERIFNGKDFSGWNFVIGPNCSPEPEGCGKTEPGRIARVENEEILCECNVHGYFYTDKKYKDFTLRFETKFEKPFELAPEDDEELFSGGSGYLILADVNAPGYPKSIEVEGRWRDLLDFFEIGGRGQAGKVDVPARSRAMRPLGQWNTIEILNKGDQVRTSLNGVPVSSLDGHGYNAAGHIVFQIQGRKMAWRNIRIKAE